MSTLSGKANSLETVPTSNVRPSQGRIPNTPLSASTISFFLGCVFATGVIAFVTQPPWLTYQLGFFFASWAVFHYGEFAVTAGWNREKCSVDSFLLENGSMYHFAHSLAVFEYLVTLYLKPSWKAHPCVTTIGIFVVIVGQALRSLSMIHAATNFSHMIAYKKLTNHQLVTDGIYLWFRHPSYAGFFYWALGTQLVLQNSFSFIVFFFLLWRFFSSRIQEEEKLLVKFFGDEYVQYRQRTGAMIPFIP
ncbi:ICMT-domain-containing protein [Vararia minispora EC-137]|uniref:ICMT-domain-containing protein n=1 Tax=Vararia minispora EC-137 TaxID=1314806 RepID=A0ACB8QY99_9AGAM|nr:ICMT-domain-containing protein [Vararia minispora EC-137]